MVNFLYLHHNNKKMRASSLLLLIILFITNFAYAQKKEDNDIKIKLIEYVVQIADTTKQLNEIDLTEHQLLNEINYFNLIDFKNFCSFLKSATATLQKI
jgi:hypothetical protein